MLKLKLQSLPMETSGWLVNNINSNQGKEQVSH